MNSYTEELLTCFRHISLPRPMFQQDWNSAIGMLRVDICLASSQNSRCNQSIPADKPIETHSRRASSETRILQGEMYEVNISFSMNNIE